MDVGVELLKGLDGVRIDGGLDFVGVVLGPEGQLVLLIIIEGLRHLEGGQSPGAVASGERKEEGRRHKTGQHARKTLHPLVPPLRTPDMIFFRKIRNSTTSGREMTTTAAIMAGMFSRPKPFSRIS